MTTFTLPAQAETGLEDKVILESLDTAIRNVPAVAAYGMQLVFAGQADPSKEVDRIHLVSIGSGAAIHEHAAFWAYYGSSPTPVEAFNSCLYVRKPSPTLTCKTLVVVVSKSGETSEMLHTLEAVRDRCHSTIVFTKKAPDLTDTNQSVIYRADKVFSLGDTDQTFLVVGMYVSALTEAMFAGKQNRAIPSSCLSSLRKLPGLAVAALRFGEREAKSYAQTYKDKRVMHIIYTGADKMVADVFGKCVLREANGISTVVEDAVNVPHHTCELAQDDNLFIFLLGGDPDLRPVVEKARHFYEKHIHQIIVYDLDELNTEGISAEYRAQFGAFILYFATKSLGPAIAEARGENFADRRFMRKIQFDMTDYYKAGAR